MPQQPTISPRLAALSAGSRSGKEDPSPACGGLAQGTRGCLQPGAASKSGHTRGTTAPSGAAPGADRSAGSPRGAGGGRDEEEEEEEEKEEEGYFGAARSRWRSVPRWEAASSEAAPARLTRAAPLSTAPWGPQHCCRCFWLWVGLSAGLRARGAGRGERGAPALLLLTAAHCCAHF